MQILQNTQPIVEFNKTIPSLQNQLNKTSEEIDGYLHFMNEIVYVRNENETKENALKRALNMLDRMLDIEKRRKLLKENCDETMKFIDDMKLKSSMTLFLWDNCYYLKVLLLFRIWGKMIFSAIDVSTLLQRLKGSRTGLLHMYLMI